MLAPQPLYHIIYHSMSSGEGMSPEALAHLLRKARAYNQDHRLTGLLLYAAGTHEFVQVIEGPRDEVKYLYDKIALDPRHKHSFVLHEALATGRMFPDWRMGFVAAATQDLRSTTGYFPLTAQPGYARPPGLAVHAPEQLRRFLADFATPLASDE
ncbi:BLUF domain-containing protein [Hymenobacter sp. H14-R3]|uniref:BLUF domain-containing protein n=1 Tax=Hymenobacter sp. H14-R3 TaxID=3046308 RepID=UPI0024B8D229|nr:BLUF domain-containing protein [Hymenobacter sp. H14-R3]MDJ0365205.1 BLUF domain-containing protein [Hymenobacter sp. H14-R3]